ncbi:hypothetical protein R6Q59_032359 [Mikania micrantha]
MASFTVLNYSLLSSLAPIECGHKDLFDCCSDNLEQSSSSDAIQLPTKLLLRVFTYVASSLSYAKLGEGGHKDPFDCCPGNLEQSSSPQAFKMQRQVAITVDTDLFDCCPGNLEQSSSPDAFQLQRQGAITCLNSQHVNGTFGVVFGRSTHKGRLRLQHTPEFCLHPRSRSSPSKTGNCYFWNP